MIQFAIALMAAGVTLYLIGVAGPWWFRRRNARITGFSKEDAELLSMPAHERVARQLAIQTGAPEFMWRRYTPLAISIILQRKP
jgi:hypothetical protein